MDIVYGGASLAVFLFLVVLTGRVVVSWVMALSPQWKPHGPVLVATEVCYAITDPPVRRALPRITIAHYRIDLAVPVLFLACYVVLNLLLVARNG